MMTEQPAVEITGTLLRTLRVAARVKLRPLAAGVGYSHTHLSKVEIGERPVVPAVILAYSQALGLDINTAAKDGTLIDGRIRAALAGERKRLLARLGEIDRLLDAADEP